MRLYEIRCVISHEISRCHSASMTTGLCSGSSHRDVMQSSVAMVYANARRNTSDQVNADALRAAASAGSVEEVRRVLALNPGCVDLRELGGVRRTALMNAGEDSLSLSVYAIQPSHILVIGVIATSFRDLHATV